MTKNIYLSHIALFSLWLFSFFIFYANYIVLQYIFLYNTVILFLVLSACLCTCLTVCLPFSQSISFSFAATTSCNVTSLNANSARLHPTYVVFQLAHR